MNMEEWESMEPEMALTDLEELQCELLEARAQDDEDEVEELQNSLREVVQDQSVKPKLQCLMVDPSFSMVTVQSEDSGIVWETASSRCSTPWASEASYSSDSYSMDGSATGGAQGKITIVFDEEKIVSRRKRTRGKSRLRDRLRRPGCSRSGSELGVERPEMTEVSVPNIRVESAESDTESGGGKDREQELFSLISEGYEILNIKVPSKLPTVDEEESTELKDNLSYLEETPRIRSKYRGGTEAVLRSAQDYPKLMEAPGGIEGEVVRVSQPLKPTDELGPCSRRDGLREIEYFEAFTLLEEVIVPGKQAPEILREEAHTMPQLEGHNVGQKTAADSLSATPNDDFVFVTDMEIASERLDEVFYGHKRHATAEDLMNEEENKEEMGKKGRKESLKSLKECGSALFGSEESILTPIFLSPGPPKIIDPGLLEEPTAMSFLYSDLYEDARGERRRSDEEGSEAGSLVSDTTLHGHLSDSEETDGYLEKFILKDETPYVECRSEEADNKKEGLMLWPERFELTGFLTRVDVDEEREGKVCKEEEVRAAEDLQPSRCEENGCESANKNHLELHCVFQEAVTNLSEVISKIPNETETAEPTTGFIHNLEAKVVKTAPQWPLAPSPSEEDNGKEVELMKRNEMESEDEWLFTHLRNFTEVELQTEATVTETEVHSETSEELEYVMIPHLVRIEKLVSETERQHICTGLESDLNRGQESEPKRDNESMEREGGLELEKEREAPKLEEKEKLERERERNKLEKGREDKLKQTQLDRAREMERLKERQEREERDRQERVIEIEKLEERQEKEREMQKLNEEKGRQERERQLELQRERDRMKEQEKKERQEREGQMELELVKEKERKRLKEESQHRESEREREMMGEKEEIRRHERERENERKERQERENARKKLKEGKQEREEERMGGEREWERLEEKQESEREKHRLIEEEKERLERERQLGLVKEKERKGLMEERQEGKKQERESELELERQRERMREEKERNSAREKLKERQEREKESEIESERLEEKQGRERKKRRLMEDKDRLERERELEKQRLKVERQLMLGRERVRPRRQEVEEKKTLERQRMMELEGENVHGEKRKRRNQILKESENPIEADFEIFDEEEESQAKAVIAQLGMDWFCLGCGCLLSETDTLSGGHQDHEVTSVETAFEDIRERLSAWISELQERSEKIEDLVSELELAYNTVEDHCRNCEVGMEAQNEEIVALVMEQYNTMSLCIEDEKKAKLEQLYDQIISFQDSIDQAKVTLETTAREAELDPDQDTQTSKDIYMRLKKALQSAMSLELGSQGLLVFEDYAKGNTANKQTQRKGIPVPQKPSLQHQECGSANSTSVTVYWTVSSGDIIDCFQVYCMEDPQRAVSDEYRVTVKESYCVLEELEPDKVYKVWVMAVNYTGCSLPSERLPFRTSPSVPMIDTEQSTILWDSATLRWSATNQTQAESYNLEYCRQYALEGEGLRSISGILGRQQRVLLHPNENYLFYIKAVNKAGASEQSEAALISTRGTRFHLLKGSVHPILKLSEDKTTIYYPLATYKQRDEAANECLSVLGELLPMTGHHYWETIVTESPAYRVGVAYGTANRDSPLGENTMSWCLHCVPTPSSCRFELLHGNVLTDVFVVDVPSRIGTFLDFQNGRLSFYNAQSGQLLGTLPHCFMQPCHPVFGMEQPGSLKISMTLKVPDFTEYG
ncbi:cardiomyopathy-associated protein 5 [Esox lucius]|uniref:cardiomyopathy-associated protein 5 n=1 Tax=Esox lucius TaxID=8010 RepID=UPI0014773838|nr:cardiomyopathy-associated protein 5 [Esox lucius]